MNIAVNTRLLLPNRLEGLGRFSHETLWRITQQHPEHKFIFIFDRPFSKEFIYSENIVPVVCRPQARHPLLWYLYFDWAIPSILKKYKVDLLFSPDGWLSLRTEVPQLPVIHDLNFFHNPMWVDFASRKYYQYFFPKFINKAKRIATVSEFTKNDINSRFAIEKNDIDVVYNGCASGFNPIEDKLKIEIRKKYTLGSAFFLVLGLVHPRKNLSRVIEAFSRFKSIQDNTIKLLVIGSIKYMSSDVQKAFKESKFTEDIIFTGRLEDEELKQIMAASNALIYASLFEGFGIPIIEAMNCKVPVITANTSSMPEVGGEAALYIDPYSVEDVANAMLEINSNIELRDKLLEKAEKQKLEFSWDKTANLVWSSIEKVLKE